MKENIEQGRKIIEVEATKDWGPALRSIKKHFNELGKNDDLNRFTPVFLKIGDNIVAVEPTYGQPNGDETPKVSGLKTKDQQNNAVNLGALASGKRIANPGSIIDSLNIKGGTSINSDIAAVEAGISEQAYGGRSALIAVMMVHKYGEQLLKLANDKKIKKVGKKNVDESDQPRDVIKDYHDVYVGKGDGGASNLAAYQISTQKVKGGAFNETISSRNGDTKQPIASTIALQYEAIKNNLKKYGITEEEKKGVLTEIKQIADNAIDSLYEDDSESEGVKANLKKNLEETITFLNDGNTLKNKESKVFDKQGGTKLKAEGPEISDEEEEDDEEEDDDEEDEGDEEEEDDEEEDDDEEDEGDDDEGDDDEGDDDEGDFGEEGGGEDADFGGDDFEEDDDVEDEGEDDVRVDRGKRDRDSDDDEIEEENDENNDKKKQKENNLKRKFSNDEESRIVNALQHKKKKRDIKKDRKDRKDKEGKIERIKKAKEVKLDTRIGNRLEAGKKKRKLRNK